MNTSHNKAQTIFQGRIFDVLLETHCLPNRQQATFEIVRHPGGAAILPILDDGRVLLIKQFRPALGIMVYEIPAGRLEPDETPQECACRELIEEAGYAAHEVSPLGGLFSAVGYCDEYIQLFLARSLVKTEQALEPDEIVELHPMPFEQALQKLASGEIPDSKTQLALLRYWQLLSKSET